MPSEKEWELMKQSFLTGFRHAVVLYQMDIGEMAERQWVIAKAGWKEEPNADEVKDSFFAGFQHAIALEKISISHNALRSETEREWKKSLTVVGRRT